MGRNECVVPRNDGGTGNDDRLENARNSSLMPSQGTGKWNIRYVASVKILSCASCTGFVVNRALLSYLLLMGMGSQDD